MSADEPKQPKRPRKPPLDDYSLDELLDELPEGWQPITWQELYAEQPSERLAVLAAEEKARQAKRGGAPTQIDGYVQRYLREHPKFEYPPSGDFHPAILAAGALKHWMIDRMRGPLPFWRAMLRAARAWFPPGDQSREYRIFCTFFEIEGCTWWQGVRAYDGLERDYLAWKASMKRPGGQPAQRP